MIRIFGHYIPVSLIVLGIIETLLLLTTLYLGIWVRFYDLLGVDWASLLPRAAAHAASVQICMIAMGLYQRDLRVSRLNILLRLGLSLAGSLLIMIGVFYLLPDLLIGRGVYALTLMFSAGLLLLSRIIFYKFIDDDRLKRRVLVLGTGKTAQRVADLRRRSDWQGSILTGFIHVHDDDDLIEADKVIGSDSDLLRIVQEQHIDEIIVTIRYTRRDFPIDALLACKMEGVAVTDAMLFFERQTGKIKIDVSHPEHMLYLDGFCDSLLKLSIKRSFDVFASLFVLLLTLPLILITMLASLLESGFRHPIFYFQERVGKDGKTFYVYKFRSMRPDAEKNGAQWAQANDNRVTALGKFIRKTRIDELPQIFNVLAGDMSFVGPRPERPQFVEELKGQIPYFAMRQRVKPGITGWAQISYPYGASIEDSKNKLEYDLYYIKNYSLFLDLTILLQTAQVVLFGTGAR